MKWSVLASTRAAGLGIAGNTTEARCNAEVGGINAHVHCCSDIMWLGTVDRGSVDDIGEVANYEICQLVASSTCCDTYLTKGQRPAGRSLRTALYSQFVLFLSACQPSL